MIDLKKIKKIHFIGIGGIGISAIGRMMLGEGREVSGSDMGESPTIKELKKLGAKIYLKQEVKNIRPDIDLVVYTIAISPTNPELLQAKKFSIPTFTYPEMLNKISAHKYTIAISGTHGKTTTTAMIAKILMTAKKSPTVIVGSILKDEKSNFIAGKSKYFVVEACEYRRSFLNLKPKIVVITNIEEDHLDYYHDLNDIESAFRELVAKLGKNDYLVCNRKEMNLKKVIKNQKCHIVDYSKYDSKKIKLKIPGKHNVENAKAALTVSKILKINLKVALAGLFNFNGTWRRFEYKGLTKGGAIVYDDYGHHPTEIKASLSALRELFSKNKITTVFQPHLYSRTKMLFYDFGRCFNLADKIIILPIYAAREKEDKTISSLMLAKKIKKNKKDAIYIKNFAEAKKYLLKNLKQNDIILTIGAGDIFKLAEKIVWIPALQKPVIRIKNNYK